MKSMFFGSFKRGVNSISRRPTQAQGLAACCGIFLASTTALFGYSPQARAVQENETQKCTTDASGVVTCVPVPQLPRVQAVRLTDDWDPRDLLNQWIYDSLYNGQTGPRLPPESDSGDPGEGLVDCNSPANTGSNPIMYSNGNKLEFETDFTTSGEVPLFFERTYSRYWTTQGILGYNWVTNFDLRLALSADQQTISLYRSDATVRIFTYRASPTAGWYSNATDTVPAISYDAGGFIYKTIDNTIETYDASGKLISQKNSRGIGITLSYSGGLLYRATHTSGRYIEFTWSGGRVVNVRDPAGNNYGYGYTPNPINPSITWLGAVVRPGTPSSTQQYHYELTWKAGALTGKSFNGVRYATYQYNDTDWATSSEHSNGADKSTYLYTFGANNQLTTVETNPLGKKTTYLFQNGQLKSVTGQPSPNCPNAQYREVTYDANGYRNLVTDFKNNITDFDYNEKGQLLRVVEATGTPLARETIYQWDSNNRTTLIRTTGLREVVYVYRPDGLLSSTTIRNLSPNGVANQVMITGYGYSMYPNGMLQTAVVDGPAPGSGDAMTISLDGFGNITSVKNSLGQGKTYSNFNGLGLPGIVVGANGDRTDYSYDARGNIQTVTTYVDAVPTTSSFAYDNRGRMWRASYADGVVEDFEYDNNNRLLKASKPETNSPYAGLGTDLRAFRRYSYNLNGDVTMTEVGVDYETGGYLMASAQMAPPEENSCHPWPDCYPDDPPPGGGGREEVVTERLFLDYDELGRVIAKRGNAGQKTTVTYDANGNVETVKDSLNRLTTFTYDVLNRLIKLADRRNGTSEFQYNAADQIILAKDSRGLVTSYVYDGLGLRWASSSPDTGPTQHTYDAAGLLTSTTLAGAQQATFTYDSLNRPKSMTMGGITQWMNYDNCQNGAGRLCHFSDRTGSVYYAYTARGRIASQVSYMPNGGSGGISYAYDGLDRLTGIGYPDGQTAVGYGYLNGKLTTITATVAGVNRTVASGILSQPYGSVSALQYGNGLTGSRSYDVDGQLVSKSTKNGMSVLQGLSYQYNTNGLIAQITNQPNAALSQGFTYDELDRVATVTAQGANQNLLLDAVGNRVSHTWGGATDSYTTASGSNQISSIAGPRPKSFSFNPNGDMTSGAGATYTYDAFQRIDSATKAGIAATYAVNALDQRVFKQVGATSTWFFNDESGRLHGDFVTPVGWTFYVYMGYEPIAMVRSGQLFFIHDDHLSRPELVTNASKAIVWRANNFAFNRTVTTNSIGGLNLGFPGQYFDAETGNWRNGARDYDPSTGRYVQSDPVGLNAGMHTYSYARGNPVSRVDPLGLDDSQAVLLHAGVINQMPDRTGSDFYHANVNLYVVSFSVTVTRSGTVYVGGGTTKGKPSSTVSGKVGWSITAGDVDSKGDKCPKTAQDVDNVINGGSSGVAGFYGIGGGKIWNSSGSATEAGFGMGAGYTPVEYNHPVGNIGFGW